MPRKPRKTSSSAIYHVILRGVNRQAIFLDSQDCLQFLNILKQYKKEHNYEIYAYCLMDNHVHLLIKEGDESISNTMKRIGIKFVAWYNKKYDRCGHLFQDRFKSEPVENEKYFWTVFRYIHQNPLNAGIETKVGRYKWTSFFAYSKSISELVNISFAYSVLGSKAEVLRFIQTPKAESAMEYYSMVHMPDEEAIRLVSRHIPSINLHTLLRQARAIQDSVLLEMRKLGITISQICRLTGVPKYSVVRATHSYRFA